MAQEQASKRSVAAYRGWAELYDDITTDFWYYRLSAVTRLGLRPGEVVVDVGCGTGLCFPVIEERIGPQGQLIGLEQCPEMLAQAARRVEGSGWGNVTLLEATAEQARLPVAASAALFCATHDVLRSPTAVANVLGQLRPGGHVAAIGGKWAPPWMPALNLAVFALHWPWVTTFEGFERPWSHIEQWVADLRVETLAGGAGFVAWGTVPLVPPMLQMGAELVGAALYGHVADDSTRRWMTAELRRTDVAPISPPSWTPVTRQPPSPPGAGSTRSTCPPA